jgi:hypothetical protein
LSVPEPSKVSTPSILHRTAMNEPTWAGAPRSLEQFGNKSSAATGERIKTLTACISQEERNSTG